jgi:hypothetical protein
MLWILPLVFVLHDTEELLTMPGWIARHEIDLHRMGERSEVVASSLASIPRTTAQAGASIGVLFLIFLVVTFAAYWAFPSRGWVYGYACLLGALFLHVFTHIIQAIYFQEYVPGLVGAMVAIVPGSLYLYKRLFEARLLTLKSAAVTALIGLAAVLPGALLAQQVGQWFTERGFDSL